jgi:hypothetical protein
LGSERIYEERGYLVAYTLETTLGELLADAKAKAILDKHLPGISSNPLAAMAKGLSLKKILAMPQAAQLGLTPKKVEGILAEINKRTKA